MATVEENLTRVYTINLGRAWLTPQHKRTDRVINMVREFAEKHMKSGEVKLDQDLNRQIWSRGKTHPPRKVRVKMVKDEDGVVTVSLYEDLPATTEEEKKPEAALAETTAAEQPKEEAKTEAAGK
jgi:large subunit ribosomal protein L31e